MGNKNTSFREKETKVDLKSRSSFRKNRKSLKKSITAPLTSYTPQLDERKGVNFNRSLPGSPHLPKASPAPSNLSKHSPSSGKLEVKIFRSYTKLNDSDRKKHFLDETPTNIRVYKRSNNGSDASLSTTRLASRSYSLPRDMCCKEHRTSTTSQSIENFSSVRRVRRSILNSSTGSRLNSVCAPSPRSYRVQKSDFANVETLKKKLKSFSKSLFNNLMFSFSNIPTQNLMSVLPVFSTTTKSCSTSTTPTTSATAVFSMLSFFEADFEVLPYYQDIILYTSEETYNKIKDYKINNNITNKNIAIILKENPRDFISLCQMALLETLREFVWEVCRVMEYQVGLLSGSLSLESCAKCVSDRVVSYIFHQLKAPQIERNSLLNGLLKGRIQKPAHPPPIVSVIIGMKELKWNLYELIDKAGLRKDTLLEKEGIEEEDAFKFYTATFSEPMVYGYRSVILTYDRVRQVYRQHTKEMEVFDEEVMHRYDDFHRTYPPYYRLFATRAFERFTAENKLEETKALEETFKNIYKNTSYFSPIIDIVFYPNTTPNPQTIQFSRFLPAFKSEMSFENKQNNLNIKNGRLKLNSNINVSKNRLSINSHRASTNGDVFENNSPITSNPKKDNKNHNNVNINENNKDDSFNRNDNYLDILKTKSNQPTSLMKSPKVFLNNLQNDLSIPQIMKSLPQKHLNKHPPPPAFKPPPPPASKAPPNKPPPPPRTRASLGEYADVVRKERSDGEKLRNSDGFQSGKVYQALHAM